MMVFAPDEGSEAVLRLEMSSDVEITGYEEPPPSPEHVGPDEGKEEQAAIAIGVRQQLAINFASMLDEIETKARYLTR